MGGMAAGPDAEDHVGIGDPNTPGGGLEPGLPGDLPKTGDDADPRPWLILLAVSAPILRYILFTEKKKNDRKGRGSL